MMHNYPKKIFPGDRPQQARRRTTAPTPSPERRKNARRSIVGPQAHHRVEAPPAHPRTELGLAAAQAGKLADNREAQAGSAVAAPGPTPEAFEGPSQLLAAQARTLVEHVHLDPRTLALGLDRHDRAGVRHVEGVRKVVVEDLLDMARHRFRELDVRGSQGHPGTFQPTLDLIALGALPAHRLISHRVPLVEIAEAFRLLETKEGGVMKVIVEP